MGGDHESYNLVRPYKALQSLTRPYRILYKRNLTDYNVFFHIRAYLYRIINPYDVLVVALLDPRHPGPYKAL